MDAGKLTRLGKLAFDRYNESKGGKTHDNKPIPPWEKIAETSPDVITAWKAGAEAVYRDAMQEVLNAVRESGCVVKPIHVKGDTDDAARFVFEVCSWEVRQAGEVRELTQALAEKAKQLETAEARVKTLEGVIVDGRLAPWEKADINELDAANSTGFGPK